MLSLTKNRILGIGFAAILLFSCYALFYKLGAEPFQDYDEATYAEVTHENALRGNPTQLTYLNLPYFRKPPLLFWMTSASTRAFSDPEFGMRFPSALAALATALLVVLVCVEAGATVPVALFGGAVLATTSGWIEFARDVRFDNLVSLFVLAAFYAGMRAARDARWYVLVGIALALALLSKNVIAVFGGVAVLAYLLLSKGARGTYQELWRKELWLGIGAFFLVAAPWHLYETLQYGAAFWHSYLGTEVLARAGMNLFPGGNNPTSAQYLWYLAQFGAPWTEAFIVLALCVRIFYEKMAGRMRQALGTALVTVAAVLLVMFTAQTKAYGYLMPLFPFLAVAVALMAQGVSVWLKECRDADWRIVFASALAFLLIMAALSTRYNALHINPYFGWELGIAEEEHAIGDIISAAHDPLVYTYGVSGLGSIIYYSHLPQTAGQYVYFWNSTSTISNTGTTFVLATTSLPELQTAFPQHRFTQDYSGRFVSLFTVTD